jgi:predicted PhzF superfamily epimerase YddE/YHI9
MKLKIYQVDAFTSRVFGGNPAAVCILDNWLEQTLMQRIANENNLSETAFAVPMDGGYEIRWFTPQVEVDLCGHATLATAHVLFEHYDHPSDRIGFSSLQSGSLAVERAGNILTLDFPADPVEEMIMPEIIVTALGKAPLKTFKGKSDFMFVFASQSDIEEIAPDFGLLSQLGGRGVIITAMGSEVDFVSRFFAPQTGVNEDPVTGSAHTTLTPYWSRVLGKKRLRARQISSRGGDLVCEDHDNRVKISGQAVTFLVGEISV